MTRMIFVNLPVADLGRGARFYEAVGFTNEPRFTDESAAAMVWSEAIYVMLLTHPKWASFTDRPIPAAGSSEVALALALEGRDAVDAFVEQAGANGGQSRAGPRLHVRPRRGRSGRACLGPVLDGPDDRQRRIAASLKPGTKQGLQAGRNGRETWPISMVS